VVDSRPQADRILVAQLTGEALHHARWRPLTDAEQAGAVAGLQALAGGRADLLAEVAGILEGASDGEPDVPAGRGRPGGDPGVGRRGPAAEGCGADAAAIGRSPRRQVSRYRRKCAACSDKSSSLATVDAAGGAEALDLAWWTFQKAAEGGPRRAGPGRR